MNTGKTYLLGELTILFVLKFFLVATDRCLKTAFIAVNAFIFSFAYVGFKNLLVLAIALLGVLVFAITYIKTISILFTST